MLTKGKKQQQTLRQYLNNYGELRKCKSSQSLKLSKKHQQKTEQSKEAQILGYFNRIKGLLLGKGSLSAQDLEIISCVNQATLIFTDLIGKLKESIQKVVEDQERGVFMFEDNEKDLRSTQSDFQGSTRNSEKGLAKNKVASLQAPELVKRNSQFSDLGTIMSSAVEPITPLQVMNSVKTKKQDLDVLRKSSDPVDKSKGKIPHLQSLKSRKEKGYFDSPQLTIISETFIRSPAVKTFKH